MAGKCFPKIDFLRSLSICLIWPVKPISYEKRTHEFSELVLVLLMDITAAQFCSGWPKRVNLESCGGKKCARAFDLKVA